jgi:hypothetical protein
MKIAIDEFRLGWLAVPVRNLTDIREKFKAIEPGMTLTSLAVLLSTSMNTARTWAKLAGYTVEDGRRKKFWRDNHPGGPNKVDWAKVDWHLDDLTLAQTHGVTRTRVWQKRKTLSQLKAKPPI